MSLIVRVPRRGLRCREPACQHPIALVQTTRGRQMPLELPGLRYADRPEDERGLYVVTTDGLADTPTARTLRAAREAGLELADDAPIYVAHWSACPARDSFRRSR